MAVTVVAVELAGVIVMPGIAFIIAPFRLVPFSVTANVPPATPLLGEMEASAEAGTTVNPAGEVATSVPVVTITSRAPSGAVAAILTFTDK